VKHDVDDSDYYAILGVAASATLSEIRGSYRRLALRHHPDVNPPDQDDAANEFMRRLNEAYDTLSDPARRAAYDRQRRSTPSDGPDPDGLEAEPRWPPTEQVNRDPGSASQRWRYHRSRGLALPDWLAGLMLVEERLRERLRPLGVWVGMLMPVVVTAGLFALGFWLYMQLRADAQSWALLTYLDELLGGTAGFAYSGILVLLLGASVVLWRRPGR
jgi:hypothetical protein